MEKRVNFEASFMGLTKVLYSGAEIDRHYTSSLVVCV